MKTSRILILTLASLSTTFVNANGSLPPCRDCDAEDSACLAAVLVAKLNCDANANAIHADALTTIDAKTNAANQACDDSHGANTLAAIACRDLVSGIDNSNRIAAYAENVIRLSLCRAGERDAKSACDRAFADCVNDVMIKRANCECE
jgi:uncharacterized protein (DUF1501 family)